MRFRFSKFVAFYLDTITCSKTIKNVKRSRQGGF